MSIEDQGRFCSMSGQQVAKRNYCDVLGFEVVLDTEFTPETRWTQLVPPGAQHLDHP